MSYQKRQTLDLSAVKSCKKPAGNTFDINGMQLLKSAVIYGANASGKSNLFRAFLIMKGIIKNSARESQSTEPLGLIPFVFCNDNKEKPSRFELEFICQDIQYRYGFGATDTAITEEWFFKRISKTKEVPLFCRTNENGADNIQVFDDMEQARNKGLEAMTRGNALFLSVCDQMNVELAKEIMRYLRFSINIISGLQDAGYKDFTVNGFCTGVLREEILGFMRNADFNIVDLEIELKDIEDDNGSKRKSIPDIRSVHNVYDKDYNIVDKIKIPFNKLESDGTQKAFALAGPVIDTLKGGKVLFIDELDSRLHPAFTRKLVQMFNSEDQNPKNAQLIFATHDSNLLNKDLLRRDQIWFAEKNHGEATELYSLIDYILDDKNKVRNDASYGKDYLSGRYGAIPFLSDLKVSGDAHE
ncbi:MAG: ATP-binding protein [Victivallaceae bacterium]